ncbi:hypothetical protein [Solicola gregarius]|uniref:Secreted protein n=1 Tax=Solicola gregarius TaxID=2908642 RepID=A0AA46YLN7_9ACTN|nr:hypothetical protein [Solicola gregarius]UYM07140.1 hypothetical protein L0C25_08700 [Solicola gregarius]
MNVRRVATALSLTAAVLLGGSMATASADTGTSTRSAQSSSAVVVQEEWDYTGQDFFWQEDCIARGQEMYDDGMIWKYRCDGSESPFDDYSLFVVWR